MEIWLCCFSVHLVFEEERFWASTCQCYNVFNDLHHILGPDSWRCVDDRCHWLEFLFQRSGFRGQGWNSETFWWPSRWGCIAMFADPFAFWCLARAGIGWVVMMTANVIIAGSSAIWCLARAGIKQIFVMTASIFVIWCLARAGVSWNFDVMMAV